MVIFGIQHYMYVDFVISMIPEWIGGRRFWTYFTGTALAAAGVASV
jgi:putative oxidoreductase